MFDFFFGHIWIKMITDIVQSDNEILEIKLTLWQKKITDLYFHPVFAMNDFQLRCKNCAGKARAGTEGRQIHAQLRGLHKGSGSLGGPQDLASSTLPSSSHLLFPTLLPDAMLQQ